MAEKLHTKRCKLIHWAVEIDGFSIESIIRVKREMGIKAKLARDKTTRKTSQISFSLKQEEKRSLL
jgi:hypothetical protein